MSSGKYEKFHIVAGSDGKEEPETRKKSSFLVVGIALVVIALVAVSVAAIAIGVGVGVSDSEDSDQSATSGLTVSTLAQEEVQGEYFSSTGGIRFKITANDSFIYISVTSSTGDPVVVIDNVIRTSTTMLSVNNTGFLTMKNRPGKPKYTDYVIPENYTNMIHSMMEGQEEISDDILQCLNDKTVNDTRRDSLESLALCEEADLIVEAAQALGSSGVVGTDYPAAMRFYLLALVVEKIRGSMEGTDHFTLATDEDVSKNSEQKRATQCSESDGGGVCEQCPTGRNCLGLCGSACSCYAWICGDCCYHPLCVSLQNTDCCNIATSSSCFFLPIYGINWDKANCDEPYSC